MMLSSHTAEMEDALENLADATEEERGDVADAPASSPTPVQGQPPVDAVKPNHSLKKLVPNGSHRPG